MKNIAWKLIEAMALQLTPAEREIVLGDLIETHETAWQRDARSIGAVGASSVAIVERLACLVRPPPAWRSRAASC